MTKRCASPVDDIARKALADLKELKGQARLDAIEELLKARNTSKTVSEQIFLLLATLLLPIILYLFTTTTHVSFLGMEFDLDNKSVFFFFFVGNLFYVYKISHFAKVVAAEKVIYEIGKADKRHLNGLTRLLPYNFFILISGGRLLTFYLKYFGIAIYTLIYFACLFKFFFVIFSAEIGWDWLLGGILIFLNAASLIFSLLVFPNTDVRLHDQP